MILTNPQLKLPELDYRQLDRDLDRAKTKVFLGRSAAFLGSLMCSMTFEWSTSIKTAATDGKTFWWNPYHFWLIKPDRRPTVIVHEIWHKGLLHMLRRGERHPRLWNQACDFAINNMMDLEGYLFDGLFPAELGFPSDTEPCLDHKYGTKSAEEIYDELVEEGKLNTIEMTFTDEDLVEPEPGENSHVIINQVVSATHAAKLGGSSAGNIPGEVETILKRFLKPKLPWKQLFLQFFTQLMEQDYSWRRPNRRFSSMYLPSLVDEDGRLDHVVYYEDVSGSVSDNEVIRFNSEVKYVWDTFKPKKMTLVQFDTRITKETVYNEGDRFEEVVIVGRGGTSLVPVREHIIEHKPSVVVVFSDLFCEVMEKLPNNLDIPILWVAINNHSAQVNQGKLIHIRE